MTDVETVIAARDIAVAAVTTTAANVDLATQQADRAEVARDAAAAPTAAQIATVDADAGSTFRVQQDARLTATFAAALHVRPGKNGVVGDGVADDTAAIQAILDQVSTSLGVVNVLVHAGTYMINGVNTAKASHNQRWIEAGLQPKTGTRLTMENGAILRIIANTSPAYSVIYLGPTVSDVQIRGGRIEGDRATHDYTTDATYPSHEWGYGVGVRGADDFLIEGVTIVNTTGDCVFGGAVGTIPGGDYNPIVNGRVIRCTLSGARRNNVSVEACDGFVIHDCDIDNAGVNDGVHDGTVPRAGIDIEGYGVGAVDYQKTLNVTITNNRIFGCQNLAIMAFNAYGCTITGNYVDNTISIGGSTDIVVADNVVINTANTTGKGIDSNVVSYKARAVIRGNVVVGFDTGINVQRDSVAVTGNHISGFDARGIYVFDADDVSVIGNTVYDALTGATTEGIRVAGNSTNVDMLDNSVHNVRTGIASGNTASKVVAAGNTITQGYIGFSVESTSQMTIKGNTTDLPGFAAGQSYSVTLSSTTVKALIVGNTFRNDSTYSVNANSGGSGGLSRIVGNTIIDSTGGTAIICAGGAHEVVDNEIIHNRASSVTGSILISSGSGSRVIGNKVSNIGAGAVVGVHTSGASSTKIAGNVLQAGATMTVATTDSLSNNTVVGGGVLAKSANYTALVTDRTILATGGAGGITITLPSAAIAGLRYEVKKVDAGAGSVTIATTSSQTIDGATTKVLAAQYDRACVVSDGAAWHVVG